MSVAATTARQRIEAAADSVGESRTAYVEGYEPRHFHTTVCNGYVKEEGEPPQGEVSSEADLPLDDFVTCCLGLRGNAKRLIWRRLPAVDEYEGRYRISARLSWVAEDA